MSNVGVRNPLSSSAPQFRQKLACGGLTVLQERQMIGGVDNSRLEAVLSSIVVPKPSGGCEPEMRVTLLSVKVSSGLNNLRPHCPQNVVSSEVSD